LIRDTVEARLAIARLVRVHRPRYVFTTKGAGVHPDHRAVTEIVVNGVFYARLPKWEEVPGVDGTLDGTDPHEIDRLFFARCRMEPAWRSFDFAVNISETFERKQAAIAAYASVFHGDQAGLVERYAAEDQYYGSLLGVRHAEPLQVYVGPTAYLTESGIAVAKGGTLEILGSRVTIGEESVIIAKQIKEGDNTWILRDAPGRPVWSGRGRSGGGQAMRLQIGRGE
jgi:hypothetical protein